MGEDVRPHPDPSQSYCLILLDNLCVDTLIHFLIYPDRDSRYYVMMIMILCGFHFDID